MTDLAGELLASLDVDDELRRNELETLVFGVVEDFHLRATALARALLKGHRHGSDDALQGRRELRSTAMIRAANLRLLLALALVGSRLLFGRRILARRHGERGVRDRSLGRRGAVRHHELTELLGAEFLAATAIEQSPQASDLVALLHDRVALLADRLKLGFDQVEEPRSIAQREQAGDAITQRLPFVVGVDAHASSVPESSSDARMNDRDSAFVRGITVPLASLHHRRVDAFEQHHQSSDVELDELALVG